MTLFFKLKFITLKYTNILNITKKIRDELEQSINQKVTKQLMLSFNQMQSQMQSQGLVLPPEPEVGLSASCVSTMEGRVNPSGQDPNTGESDKYGLYVDDNPPRLVALGRVYEGLTTIHSILLGNDQVKVIVEEV